MTREQQYWEDTQEALSRIFDRCEEIDPQSGYEMLEDIQFIRGFINKCKPRTEKQEPKTGQYEKHTDHTDCIWYGSDSGCPVTCSQYTSTKR